MFSKGAQGDVAGPPPPNGGRRRSILRYGAYVFSVGGARVAGMLITSLTFPFLVRRLGVEMYGLWSYVVAICAFMDVVANPGLNTHAIQQVAAHRKAAFASLPDVLVLRVLSSLVAAAVLMAVCSLEVRQDVRQLLRWFGLGLLVTNLLASDYLLGALEMFHERSLLSIIQQAVYAIGVFVFVRSPKDVLWVPASILFSALLSGLAGWTVLWHRGYRLGKAVHPGRWRQIIVPSGHYALSSVMSNLYHRTGHIVVRWWLGEHALGLYAAAVRFVDLLRQLVVIVLNVLMPRMALASKSELEMGRLTRVASTAIALVSIPLMLGLISTAHLVVPWVLGPQYLEDVSLLRWMSPYVVTASAASLLSGTVLFAMGRHRDYLLSTSGGAFVGMLLYVVLVPTMGITGAGLSLVLAELAVAMIAYALLPHGLGAFWKDPLIGIALLSAIGMMVGVKLVDTYYSQPLVVVSVGALIYATGCGWSLRKWVAQQLRSPS